MRIYISGPITNTPDYMDNFKKAEEWLLKEGQVPINPTLHEPACLGECTKVREGYDGKPHTWECYLRYDIIAMLGCEVVYVLDGWERSRGAQLEVSVASNCGLEIVFQSPKNQDPVPLAYHRPESLLEEGNNS